MASLLRKQPVKLAQRLLSRHHSACVPLLLLPLLLSASITSRARKPSQPAPTSSASSPLPDKLASTYRPHFSMAWQCSGHTNRELVDNMAKAEIIQTQRVYDAMLAVDRACFLPPGTPAYVSYQDSPQSLGTGATISAPHMHAMALELMANHLKPGARALDVGSGSGYLAAAMARMCVPSGTDAAAASAASSAGPCVFGVEHISALVTASQQNLQRWNAAFSQQRIHIVHGDGRLGWAGTPQLQFDAVHVGAAAPSIPQALIDQLAPGGVLVIPVGPDGGEQTLELLQKNMQGKITQKTVTGVRYVPLTDEQKQIRKANKSEK